MTTPLKIYAVALIKETYFLYHRKNNCVSIIFTFVFLHKHFPFIALLERITHRTTSGKGSSQSQDSHVTWSHFHVHVYEWFHSALSSDLGPVIFAISSFNPMPYNYSIQIATVLLDILWLIMRLLLGCHQAALLTTNKLCTTKSATWQSRRESKVGQKVNTHDDMVFQAIINLGGKRDVWYKLVVRHLLLDWNLML